jgi:hypothetical protein
VNICFFLGGFYQNGGIGRVTAMLANQMVQSGEYHITALCYCNPNLPNIYDVSPTIEQRFFLQTYSSMAKQLVCGGVKRLRQFLKENDIDVLIACGTLFYPISVLACKGIKTKSICWEHSDPEGNNDHRGQYWARKFGIKRSDMNVVLTKRALKVFIDKYGADNTVQIYNPVDAAVFAATGEYDPESKKIISVGRLTYQKNFQAAVKVASEVLPKFPDWQWDIFGQGEDLEELIRLAKEAQIDEQMHFNGQVTDLYERYKQYSIMVMTSRYEGFPMTLLEGIGNGLPLVSFDIPTGPSEIIDDGENGYLLQEGDINGMVYRLDQLMSNQNLRIAMSDNSRTKSRAFAIQDITEEFGKALHAVV